MLDKPIIGNVIRDTYFEPDGRRRPSLAASHAELFTSSDYYNPHEKEVPEAMVALACAAVRFPFGYTLAAETCITPIIRS